MSVYSPISCSFYSELEQFIVLNTRCRIVYNEGGKVKTYPITSITDIFTRKGEEFIKLENEHLIRLDQIVSVNELYLNDQVC